MIPMDDMIYTQWFRLKIEYPDHLVLMRLGDFVETFDEDAQAIAKIFDLILRKTNGHPMAGFPYAAAEKYFEQLVEQGRKLAFAEQVIPPVVPKSARVKRLVTQSSLFD